MKNMINFSDVAGENTIERNATCPQNLYYSWFMQNTYVGYCGSGKTNALLNLINLQIDIHKTYLCAKDSYDVKY